MSDRDKNGSGEPPGLALSLHGPGVTIDDMVKAAEATKELLAAIGEQIDAPDVEWEITSISFQCDGCHLKRPNRPGPDEGWTYRDGDDLCPECSTNG